MTVSEREWMSGIFAGIVEEFFAVSKVTVLPHPLPDTEASFIR